MILSFALGFVNKTSRYFDAETAFSYNFVFKSINIMELWWFPFFHMDRCHPHRLALGLFLAWTPAIGLQMLALRANVVVGIPMVWISNPVTMGPIYLWNYLLGRKILSFFHEQPETGTDELKEMMISF